MTLVLTFISYLAFLSLLSVKSGEINKNNLQKS
uniref:Uncharacterized protein n=1 Tax=Arundo donax TaxID=35708 RepID=A0A0A9AXF4_ARUDO